MKWYFAYRLKNGNTKVELYKGSYQIKEALADNEIMFVVDPFQARDKEHAYNMAMYNYQFA